MKIRAGFVSNSSSSSYVIIDSSGKKHADLPVIHGGSERILRIPFDLHNPHAEFGWEQTDYRDFESKLCFACLQACYHDGIDDRGVPVLGDWHEMIERVLKKELNLTKVEFFLTTGGECDPQYGFLSPGYIDHQSSAEENENTEIFDSDRALSDFLFNEGSYIHGDNDNHG